MAEPKEKPKERGAPRLRAVWNNEVASHLEQLFADNLHLAQVNDQFFLTFGQTRVPIIEVENQSEAMIAEIRPVAKLVIPKVAFERIAKLFADRSTKKSE